MASQQPSVREIIDDSGFSWYQVRILVLGALVLLLDGYDVAAIGFVAPALVGEWGIARPELAPVLSAALIGLAIGAVASGPLADRVGRRSVVIVSVLVFGVFTLLSALASSLEQLTLLRFATGLGLGGAFPNTVTLVSEYCPAKRRAFLISLVLTGFVLGTAVGGYVSAAIISSYGWRSVLFLGGVLPLILGGVLICGMPESMRFLAGIEGARSRLQQIVERIAPGRAREIAHGPLADDTQTGGNAPVRALFTHGKALGSLMLWTAYFSGLVVVYFILSWLPTLAVARGYSLEAAAIVGACFTLSGPAGAMLAGWVMDRGAPHLVIGASFLAGALALGAVGSSADSLQGLAFAIGAAGFFVNAAQSALSALAANFYPTIGRATGVSFMMGVGRLGGILGAAIGGPLLAFEMGFSSIFVLLAGASATAGFAVLCKGMRYARRDAAPIAADATGQALTASSRLIE